jgi:hypothetical protein
MSTEGEIRDHFPLDFQDELIGGGRGDLRIDDVG